MATSFNDRLAGLLVQKELEVLSKIRENPYRPFIVVVGGAKIKDKINALKNLINKADKVLVGGGVAYTFLASKGISVGESAIEEDLLKWAKEVLNKNEKKILLPEDHIISPTEYKKGKARLTQGEIPKGFLGLDIGQKTSARYTHEIMSGIRITFDKYHRKQHFISFQTSSLQYFTDG